MFREIYETKIKAIGFVMRAFEVLSLSVYYNIIFFLMFETTTWWLLGSDLEEIIKVIEGSENMLGGGVTKTEKMAIEILSPSCLTEKVDKHIVFGGSQEWFFIELLVFFSFLSTMSFLMIKSRFMNIGIDNSS